MGNKISVVNKSINRKQKIVIKPKKTKESKSISFGPATQAEIDRNEKEAQHVRTLHTGKDNSVSK